jgi:hypothetical protein
MSRGTAGAHDPHPSCPLTWPQALAPKDVGERWMIFGNRRGRNKSRLAFQEHMREFNATNTPDASTEERLREALVNARDRLRRNRPIEDEDALQSIVARTLWAAEQHRLSGKFRGTSEGTDGTWVAPPRLDEWREKFGGNGISGVVVAPMRTTVEDRLRESLERAVNGIRSQLYEIRLHDGSSLEIYAPSDQVADIIAGYWTHKGYGRNVPAATYWGRDGREHAVSAGPHPVWKTIREDVWVASRPVGDRYARHPEGELPPRDYRSAASRVKNDTGSGASRSALRTLAGDPNISK